MYPEPDETDPGYDEICLERARRVMRERFPDRTHWMLMDTPERQEEWERERAKYGPFAQELSWRVKIFLWALAALLVFFVFLAGRGLLTLFP